MRENKKKSIFEMFEDFYEQMRGIPMDDRQMDTMKKIIRAVGGDKE